MSAQGRKGAGHTAGPVERDRYITRTELALLREAEAALGETDLRPRELVAELHEAEDVAAELRAQLASIEDRQCQLVSERDEALERVAGLEAALGAVVTEADQTGGRDRTVSRYTVDRARAALAGVPSELPRY